MTTHTTKTLTVTIDAPFEQVAKDLAKPASHAEWGREFFRGPATAAENGSVMVESPVMGGPVRFRVEADEARGIFDLYLAPGDAPYGPPLPVRLIGNGDGVDVLWTLARPAQQPDEVWEAGLASMSRELQGLKRRHEGR